MFNSTKIIEWTVLQEDVQNGIPVGYKVELSTKPFFYPVIYRMDTYSDEWSEVLGTFYYSLDDGVTWVGYVRGAEGVTFDGPYKMRVSLDCGRLQYVFAERDGKVYRVAADGYEVIESYDVTTIDSTGFEIDVCRDSLYLTGKDKTGFFIETREVFAPGDNSLNLLTEPIGMAIDGVRDTLWQVDTENVYLKNLKGQIIKSFPLPFPISPDIMSSSSSSSYFYSSSSSSSSEGLSSTSSSMSDSSGMDCTTPSCSGACSGFSNWYLTGVRQSNSTRGTLYGNMIYSGSSPRATIDLYKEVGKVNKVASGATVGLSPETIVISNVSGSGINGTVDYDGVVYTSGSVIIRC